MAQEIIAPMAGKVIEVKVKAGDVVKEDDEILVMESMKMESPIFAPCDGTVQEISPKVGDEVDEDGLIGLIQEK